MLPKQRDLEVPLLEVLVEISGQGRPRDIYPLVAKKFPQILATGSPYFHPLHWSLQISSVADHLARRASGYNRTGSPVVAPDQLCLSALS